MSHHQAGLLGALIAVALFLGIMAFATSTEKAYNREHGTRQERAARRCAAMLVKAKTARDTLDVYLAREECVP